MTGNGICVLVSSRTPGNVSTHISFFSKGNDTPSRNAPAFL